jgi:hypothetical protein
VKGSSEHDNEPSGSIKCWEVDLARGTVCASCLEFSFPTVPAVNEFIAWVPPPPPTPY